MKKVIYLIVFVAINIIFAGGLFSGQVIPAQVTFTMPRADIAFEARCTSVSRGEWTYDGGNYHVEKIKFEITNWIKGEDPKGPYKKGYTGPYELRQSRLMALMAQPKSVSWVTYKPGETYILLLSKENVRGDRFPLGFDLSKFVVSNGMVANIYNNVQLFKGLSVNEKVNKSVGVQKTVVTKLAGTKSGAVSRDEFMSILSALAE